MIKLLAIYRKPEDQAAFLDHYERVHVPLARKVPGLERLVLDRVVGDPFGREPDFFLVAEMHFPDRVTFDAAMASPENQALGRDLMSFAKGIVSVVVAESIDG